MKCSSASAPLWHLLAALPAAGRTGPSGAEFVYGEAHRDEAIPRSSRRSPSIPLTRSPVRRPFCPATRPARGPARQLRPLRRSRPLARFGAAGAGPTSSDLRDNGGEFVQRLRRERPDLFMDLELPVVRAVVRAPGPVRVWQAIEPRGADGRAMEAISFLEVNGKLQCIGRARHLAGVMPSLVQRATRQDLAKQRLN